MAAGIVTIMLPCLNGCGSNAPSISSSVSNIDAKVSGKITVKGKPAEKGKVTIEPVNASPLAGLSREADIQKDGSYEVTTKVGKNSVIVGGTGNPAADGSYNSTTFDVKEGTNTLNLDLPLNK
jgi:hypothetical protein